MNLLKLTPRIFPTNSTACQMLQNLFMYKFQQAVLNMDRNEQTI